MVLWATAGLAVAGGRGAPVRLLGIREFNFDVELRYEQEQERHESKAGGPPSGYREKSFHEIFNFAWRGYIYHPRFLDFSAAFGFDVEQTGVDVESVSEGGTRRYNLVSPLYKVSGTFLGEHPVSVSFALSRQRAAYTAGFGELTETESESQQVRVRRRSAVLPAEAFFSRRIRHEDQRAFGEQRDEATTKFGFSLEHYLERSTSQMRYEWTDETEEIEQVFGNVVSHSLFERQVHDLDLRNRLSLGEKGQSSLNSAVTFRDEAGIYPSTRLLLNEILHLRHSPSLSTDYALRYSNDKVGDQTTSVVGGRAGLTHQLYESLTTRAQLYGSRESFDGGGRDIRGGSLDLAYRKRVPHGLLFINLGFGHELTDETGRVSIRNVADEPQELNDAVIVFLDNFDVIESTIFVTNATGSVTYFRDIDYRVVPRGRLIELRRIPGGDIANRETVLVDYTYQMGAPINFSTDRFRWRVQLDLFDLISLYAGVSRTRQNLISGIDEGRLESVTDTLYGARLTYGPATLTVEHQNYDSTHSPFVSDMVSLEVRQHLNRVHTVALTAIHRHVSFAEGEEATTRSISGSYYFSPRYGPSVEFTAGVEREDDRGFSSEYVFARLEASYRIRATEFNLTWWTRDRDDDFADDLEEYLLFSVRREF